jgi:hypothetical protein
MKEFKLIIAGGRDFSDYGLLSRECDKALLRKAENCKITIISGGAAGADSLGEKYAKERGYEIKRFPADWKNQGKSAGMIRNAEMVKIADAAMLFWDGMSRGTKNTKELMERANKPLKIVKYATDPFEGLANCMCENEQMTSALKKRNLPFKFSDRMCYKAGIEDALNLMGEIWKLKKGKK